MDTSSTVAVSLVHAASKKLFLFIPEINLVSVSSTGKWGYACYRFLLSMKNKALT